MVEELILRRYGHDSILDRPEFHESTRRAALSRFSSLSFDRALTPERIDGWIDEEFEQKRCHDATHHWCSDALHDLRSRARRPQNWNQANAHGGKGHELRTKPLGSPFDNRLVQVLAREAQVFTFRLFVGKVEIEQHEDAGLCVDPQQSNDAHPDRDAHVVTK